MNQYIVGSRDSGKTRRLFEYAKESGAVVVCKNPSAMRRKAEAYGVIGLSMISYDELIHCNAIYDSDVWIGEPFVVDEVNDFLTAYFGGPCVGFTQSEDD